MTHIIVDGVEVKEKLLSDLLSTIKKNNEVTTEQNNRLSRYTKWLIALTIAIAVLTAVMVVLMVLQYNYKQPSSIVPPKQYSTAPLEPPQTKIDNNTEGTKKKAGEQTKP